MRKQDIVYCPKAETHLAPSGLGGKASSLVKLTQAGLNVPPFLCVRAELFNTVMASIDKPVNTILNGIDFDSMQSIEAASNAIQTLIVDADIGVDSLATLQEAVNALPGDRFAVRSSATHEDGSQHSMAGQLTTELNVTKESVVSMVKQCWASGFAPGLLVYLQSMKQSPLDNGVTVVVQAMIDAECAGVMFQADPFGQIQNTLVTAGFGLGEGVVADKVESDNYVYDRLSRKWSSSINQKTKSIVSAESGVEERDVEQDKQMLSVLSDEQLAQLLTASGHISNHYHDHGPQDIEWCYDKEGSLFILQSRPITTLQPGIQRMFDNANIAESYPGVVSPMTFSIVWYDYYLCFSGIFERLGVPASIHKKHEEVLRHMVGYIKGRSYYNLTNWYQVLGLVPAMQDKLMHSFKEMIISDVGGDHSITPIRLTWWEKVRLGLAVPFNFIVNAFGHERMIRYYEKQSAGLKQKYAHQPVSSDQQIGQLLEHVQAFMRLLQIPLMNDAFVILFTYVASERLISSGICADKDDVNEYLIAGDVESAIPLQKLILLADQLRENPALRSEIDTLVEAKIRDKDALFLRLNQSGFAPFSDPLKRYFKEYGHRSPKELVMEYDTYMERPYELLKVIKQMSERSRIKPSEPGANDQPHMPEGKWLTKLFLHRARRALAHRESTRIDRGRHFGAFRRQLHAIGHSLVAEGMLNEWRDVFYLTLTELDDFRQACSPHDSLITLVELRKASTEVWHDAEPPAKFISQGHAYAMEFPRNSNHQHEAVNGQLTGIGCSKGVVEGIAMIVDNPSDVAEPDGKILVSKTTDPGWVFLMSVASGLISERGSLLSHTAIIGRELSIPTVVNIKNATSLIKDGDRLRVDGARGTVDIIN